MFLVNPVTLLGIVLRSSGVPLADDFEAQQARWERLCKERVNLGDRQFDETENPLPDVCINLLLASGLPIELWSREGRLHLLGTEDRKERGWLPS